MNRLGRKASETLIEMAPSADGRCPPGWAGPGWAGQGRAGRDAAACPVPLLPGAEGPGPAGAPRLGLGAGGAVMQEQPENAPAPNKPRDPLA